MRTHKAIVKDFYYEIACQPTLMFSIFRKGAVKWSQVTCKRCLKMRGDR